MSTAAVVVHDPAPSPSAEPLALVAPAAPRLGLLKPVAQPAEIIQAQEAVRALIQEALQEGRDYGKIPGIDKPSLLKPGAERVCLAFGCTERFTLIEKEVDHDRPVPWRKVKAIYEGPKGNKRKVRDDVTTGESLGLYRYVMQCDIVHRETGQIVGSSIGSCSTMESKYVDRPRDCENTIIKMAQKRAHVGATLNAFGLSEQFTQDVEDLPREVVSGAEASDDDAVKCPKCHGAMWDNRERNDERVKAGQKRMPDYKCKTKSCEHVIWDAVKFAEELAKNDATAREYVDRQVAVADMPSKGGGSAADGELYIAQALPLMGKPESWDNHGGKPLEACPDKVLRHAKRFFESKVRDGANPRMEEQLHAIDLVLRDREANSEQLSLDSKPKQPEPADTFQDLPGALADKDDDLPF